MSIHIYVVPFTAYFSGDFQTIAQKLGESAGAPGFLITGQGFKSVAAEDRSELQMRRKREAIKAWVRGVQEALQKKSGRTVNWNETGGLRYSTNMSRITYAGLYQYPQGQADDRRVLETLMTVAGLVPVELQNVVRFDSPLAEEPLQIASSFSLLSSLQGLQDTLRYDERWRRTHSLLLTLGLFETESREFCRVP